ncbi:MAG TPA: arsenate reductase family protein [Coleofasciculaceae cyanobacterium]
MLKFYGKKSCITCQKAKAFLEGNQVAFEDIPIETRPPAREILDRLIDPANVKASLNVRSTIYKEKNLGKQVPDKQTAIALMLADPNLIKRPVIMDTNGQLYQGFDEASLQAFLKR